MSLLLGATLVIGPLEFQQPWWLVAIPVLWALSWWIARKSLAGMESAWKVMALVVRLIVIVLLVGALAEPWWRKQATELAVTAIVDASDSIPTEQRPRVRGYFEALAEAGDATGRDNGRLGFVTVARDASVAALPSRLVRTLDVEHQGQRDASNLAAGLRLALAVAPKDAGNRLLLVSDGNQTAGNLLAAAQVAQSLGIPVDVLPVEYTYDGEVIVDRVVSPPTAREGETMNVRVVMQASKPARGRLNLLLNGQPIDLDASTPAIGTPVELRSGQNVLQVPVTALATGPQKFEAVFESDTRDGRFVGDTLAQNNRGESVTFVSGEGRVLVIRDDPNESGDLERALREANIRADVVSSTAAPAGLSDLAGYEAVVMVNQSAYNFSQRQQEELRQFVSDTGGGLLMIGGPNAFGAGGWIGSPLEEALPIRLDPPQKRQMPKGALALCIHSIEMPDGTFYGKKVSEAAVSRLSRLDLVGINEYNWNTGRHEWVYEMAPVGDGTAVRRAINRLTFGDMQDFTPSFQQCFDALMKAEAGQRHMIVISDGDPQPPPASLLQRFRDNRITVSTVGVYPHSTGDLSRLEEIARFTGGRFYSVTTQAGLATLPEIFTKEAMTVRRSLIWERPGGGVTPQMVGGTDALRGIGQVPNINGYVVTAEREGLAQVSATIRGSDPATADPLLAQWQYGLGRVVAYTSDATTRWGGQWVGWQGYRQFWEQHVRWVLRPQGSPNVRVSTESAGDSTRVTVEAFDTQGERMSFARFRGRLARPDGSGEDVVLQQVGPGRFQAVVPTELSGSYVLSLRYSGSDPTAAGGVIEGAVQAAISRPFADEYRALTDNRALLRQVAEATGGRVLSGDPNTDRLWDKEGIELPVATTPIWLTVALAGVALFLVDVGIRRVRIDPAMIGRWLRRITGRSTAADASQVGSLRAARASARQRIEASTKAGGTQLSPAELERQARQAVKDAAATAGVKFEASAQQQREATSQGPVALGGADVAPGKTPTKARPTDAGGAGAGGAQRPGGAGEEGMNRLMQAKKKAREGMKDEPPAPGLGG